jgi:serine/threonine protein kinase
MAMIADFGISNVVMTHASAQKNAGGTMKWMAPELLGDDDQQATGKSDICRLPASVMRWRQPLFMTSTTPPNFNADLDRENAIS